MMLDDPKTLDCLQYLATAVGGALIMWLLNRFKRK